MFFNKIHGKIFDVKFTPAEQKALDAAIIKQILEDHRKFQIDHDAAILEMLHVHFGFWSERLHRAWLLFYDVQKQLEEHYEMPKEGGWLCRKNLLKIGVDIEKWYAEKVEK